jgi:hypothetical protein
MQIKGFPRKSLWPRRSKGHPRIITLIQSQHRGQVEQVRVAELGQPHSVGVAEGDCWEGQLRGGHFI